MPRRKFFWIIDTETSREYFPVFDFAWKVVDREGNTYEQENFFIPDCLSRITPKWDSKVNQYKWIEIKSNSFAFVRDRFHDSLRTFCPHSIVPTIVAFNAEFDRAALGLTTELMLHEKQFITVPHNWIDLWGWWCQSAPKAYTAKINRRGVKSTTLESIYRYEFAKPRFKKRGTAKADTEVCTELFLKTAARKKKIPYTHPQGDFEPPWKIFSSRFS
jgi:hypothetical protein